MPTFDEADLRLEIEELTDLLRNDATWANLREILREKGFDPATTLLASFMEDEECNEYGVLVTREKRVIEYQRCMINGQDNSASWVTVDITNRPERLADYPQVPIALALTA